MAAGVAVDAEEGVGPDGGGTGLTGLAGLAGFAHGPENRGRFRLWQCPAGRREALGPRRAGFSFNHPGGYRTRPMSNHKITGWNARPDPQPGILTPDDGRNAGRG